MTLYIRHTDNLTYRLLDPNEITSMSIFRRFGDYCYAYVLTDTDLKDIDVKFDTTLSFDQLDCFLKHNHCFLFKPSTIGDLLYDGHGKSYVIYDIDIVYNTPSVTFPQIDNYAHQKILMSFLDNTDDISQTCFAYDRCLFQNQIDISLKDFKNLMTESNKNEV